MKNNSNTLKISCLCLVFNLFLAAVSGQNMVPNASFETLVSCPTGSGQVGLAEPWLAALTPDLYNPCAVAVTYQAPLNQGCNYLPAKDGVGYVGLFVFNSREYVNVALTDTLEKGKYYYVSFFVAPDQDCDNPGEAKTFTDAIGLAVQGFEPNSPFKVVAENRGTVINDTQNWTKVSGCFAAEGNELNLRIGNFLPDDSVTIQTDMPQLPITQQFNYMYVDDVVLVPFDPFPDTVLMCDGQPVNLDATFYDADFQWVTGEDGPFILALDTGSYEVEATLDGCVLREKVAVVNLDYDSFFPPDTLICIGNELRLSPQIPGEYRWSDGSRNKQLTVKQEDEYVATITNTCGEFTFRQQVNTTDCRCRLFVPNAFSPNADGINDELRIGFGCDFEFVPKRFEVYDRWGANVFVTDDPLNDFWDGEKNGKLANQDVYTWYFIYDVFYENAKREILEEGSFVMFH